LTETLASSGAMPAGRVDLARRGAILMVGLNRPSTQNRLDAAMLTALGKAWFEFEQDAALRVAVLHAVGPDFCLGLDVASFTAAVAAGEFPPKDSDVMTPLDTRPPYRTKPLVVAVRGRVAAAGHELFLSADVRIAAKDARFRQAEAAFGAFPGGGATVRFPREAGWGRAMRYMLTGDEWGAEEALALGLVQHVTPPGQELDHALAIANKIAAAAPLGVEATLASAHRAIHAEEAALQAVLPAFLAVIRSDDAKEGQRALREGRRPDFRAR
jgi:enoyl-CoA hydratase